MKRFPRARGLFYPSAADPQIGLNPTLGRDYDQFARTLAHEVGHLVDFLSERDMKRGNILGRIASLRNYLQQTIEALPSDESRALEPTDRRALRRAAEKLVGPKPKESSERPAWSAAVSERYAELLRKEITERGLLTRDQVHEELIAVSEWWRPYDRASAPEAFVRYRESSVELYADAVSVLLNSPGSLQQRAPVFFDAFLAFLDQKPEVASTFNAIQDTLAGGEESVHAARRADLEEDFARGEELQRAAEDRQDPQSLGSYLKQTFINRIAPVADAERKRLGGSVPAHSAQRAVARALEEYAHADNANRVMLMDVEQAVHRPMIEGGITGEQAGMYLMLHRIAEGDRGGMAEQAKEAIMDLTGKATWLEAREAFIQQAKEQKGDGGDFDPDLLALADSGVLNPRGYTPEEARRTLAGLKRDLGDERFATLEDLMSKFRAILFRSVEEAVEVGSYSRAKFESTIQPNRETYVPFAVLDYFNGRMPAGVKQQMGTLKGIANPYTTAILKAMSLNRLNEVQKAKRAILSVIDVDFPGAAGPEQKIDRFRREKPAGEGKTNLTYLVDGSLHYREVDTYIAKVLEKSDLGSTERITKTLTSATYSIFHPLYVSWSIAWQMRNLPRDWKRTYKNLSAAHAGKPTHRQVLEAFLDLIRTPAAYAQTAGAAWEHARQRQHPMIREMIRDRSLGRAFHSFEPNATDRKHERLLQEYGLVTPEGTGFAEKARKVGRPLEITGVFQETLSKAAAYRILTDMGITDTERAAIVRNYTGTPASTNRGLFSEATNSLFMYANVISAGIRADAEVAMQPSTAAGYWFRSVLVDFGPKALIAAAVMGWLGDELEEWYKRIPSYDLEKYLIVPVAPFWSTNELGEKKAVYLRFPHDDVNRMLAGATWALMVGDRPHAAGRTIGLVAGQFPGLSPALSMPLAWGQAAANRNPYDAFRGREIVPRTEWEAGGWSRAKEMLRWTLGEFGVISQALGRFTYHSPEDGSAASGEKTLRSVPGLSALIQDLRSGAHGAAAVGAGLGITRAGEDPGRPSAGGAPRGE